MATRVKESGVRGKEKKGTNQVDQTIPQHKRNTNKTTTTTTTTTSSKLSVPNYLKPTTASSGVVAGDKPNPSRRKSLDRPVSHLDTHRNLAGDNTNTKPSVARRKSFDRPIPPSSLPSSKPSFGRTKSSLDNKPKPSISRTSTDTNDSRGKMFMRSASAVGKSSSSSITPHHLKASSDKSSSMAKSSHNNNNTRKQPGTNLSSRPIKKKPAEIITHHQEPSVTESEDHNTEAFTNTDSNHTEISSNNKIVQEKENTIVAEHDEEELEDLKSIEHCSILLVQEDPTFDLVETITEEGEEEEPVEITGKLQESGENPDNTILIAAGDPHFEDNEGEIDNLKETTSIVVVDTNSGDEASVEEKGEENMQPNCENCNEDTGEKQEKEEKTEQHQQELVEEIKQTTDEHNNNNTNNNVVVPAALTTHQEAKPVLKRNESVVSNDVIEETASKLREQRKNKVKALAGAFETVISLQDK